MLLCFHDKLDQIGGKKIAGERTIRAVKEFRIKRTAHIVNITENTDTPEKARTLKKRQETKDMKSEEVNQKVKLPESSRSHNGS